MLGPFATASRRTPINQVSPVHRCPRRRRTTTTTTTTTRDRGDRYGPMEWAQLLTVAALRYSMKPEPEIVWGAKSGSLTLLSAICVAITGR